MIAVAAIAGQAVGAVEAVSGAAFALQLPFVVVAEGDGYTLDGGLIQSVFEAVVAVAICTPII
ncbi:MAG: hypothetical protein L3J28_11050 [Candidatus Polarisedimenticolaceae bacterium]|nr:hypothetical protein [Candidatus Polarisedimenticolaceae bacterium]